MAEKMLEVSGAEFRRALEFIHKVSKSFGSGYYSGIATLEVINSSLRLTTTDGECIATYEISNVNAPNMEIPQPIHFPSKAIQLLEKKNAGSTFISFHETFMTIHVSDDEEWNIPYSSIEPPIPTVEERERKLTFKILSGKRMASFLRVAPLFVGKSSSLGKPAVCFHLQGNKMTVAATSTVHMLVDMLEIECDNPMDEKVIVPLSYLKGIYSFDEPQEFILTDENVSLTVRGEQWSLTFPLLYPDHVVINYDRPIQRLNGLEQSVFAFNRSQLIEAVTKMEAAATISGFPLSASAGIKSLIEFSSTSHCDMKVLSIEGNVIGRKGIRVDVVKGEKLPQFYLNLKYLRDGLSAINSSQILLTSFYDPAQNYWTAISISTPDDERQVYIATMRP